MMRALAMAAVVSAAAWGQDSPSTGGVNEVRVNEAIEKGIKYLRSAPSPDFGGYDNSDELILWTFIHARVPVDDPRFKELFTNATKAQMHRTYKVDRKSTRLNSSHVSES